MLVGSCEDCPSDVGSIPTASTMRLVSNRFSTVNDRLPRRRFLSCNSLAFRRFRVPETCGRAAPVQARNPPCNPPSALSFSERCGLDLPRPHVEKSSNLLALSHARLGGSKVTYGVGFEHFRTASRIERPGEQQSCPTCRTRTRMHLPLVGRCLALVAPFTAGSWPSSHSAA